MSPSATRRREIGRGERVIPGIWRLRLPVSYPGVPHANAWALAAGDGVVLVDCGLHEPGSLAHLERAMHQVNLRLEHVRLLVCTHAHYDHYGQAADVVDASGCELWMHPDHEHATKTAQDPDRELERRLEIARHSGVPDRALRRIAAERRGKPVGVTRIVLPDRALVAGVEIETDVGTWRTYETPGHAPSHVCLHEPGRRILISGDHLLGRISPYFDLGYSRDPVGQWVTSLELVDGLDARLCLSGHGRTFTDVRAHVRANRQWLAERLSKTVAALEREGPSTVFELLTGAYDEAADTVSAGRRFTDTMACLRHLELAGRVRADTADPQRWDTV